MSKHKHGSDSDFVLEGRFLGFTVKDGYKLKYMRLSTATGEHVIKLDKELRSTLWRTLTPGEWVQVTGYEKQCEKKDKIKLKAYQVTAIAPGLATLDAPPIADSPKQPKPTPKPTILVCQKSDCCKRGGGAVSQALQAALDDRQLTDQVVIKPTGCMKRCKAGPHIVMPDKTRYSGISPTTVPDIIDKHFHDDQEP